MKFLTMLIFGISTIFGAVDINNATVKELSALHGIGKSKAEAIITYRNGHCFKSVNELIKVKGIGQKTIDYNGENLYVGACKK